MDRKIDAKGRRRGRAAAVAALGLIVAAASYLLLGDLSVPTLRVQRERLLIASVDRGPLGPSSEAIRLARGAFFQTTGGQWVFVVDEAGDEAVRRPVRLGRQSPDHHEVLSGLEPGERVITSSYQTFGDAERLILE